MGREAECECRWGDETGHCLVLLESTELIVRGAMRHRVPLSSVQDIAVQGESLSFNADGVPITLSLGISVALKWAAAIVTPPPGLGKKLGITDSSHVLLAGKADAAELKAALTEAASVNTVDEPTITLILIRASTSQELESRLGDCWPRIDAAIPVWIVYPKGKTSTLGETAVREKMRALGCIDTKVASVSEELTALRFVKRILP